MLTPKYKIPLIPDNGIDKATDHRRLVQGLEPHVYLSVEGVLITPPVITGADNGKCWIVAGTPIVEPWVGHNRDIACIYAESSTGELLWQFRSPEGGWRVYNKATSTYYIYEEGNNGWRVERLQANTPSVTSTTVGNMAYNATGDVIGALKLAGDLYSGAFLHANPDYVFEQYFTGKITKFKDNIGAKNYEGLLSMDALEAFLRKNLRFPGISDEAMPVETRIDTCFEYIEQMILRVIESDKRLDAIASKHNIELETALNADITDL